MHGPEPPRSNLAQAAGVFVVLVYFFWLWVSDPGAILGMALVLILLYGLYRTYCQEACSA
jgi:hypothetical protein